MTVDGSPGTAAIVDSNDSDDDNDDDKYFMRKSLEVAQRALEVGEVPVGCVIVLDKDHPAVLYKKNRQCKKENVDDNDNNFISKERCGVIISHGANQVNATRDATRHAEVVAIDRILTDSVSSDQLRLPPGVNRNGDEDANNSQRSSCTSIKKLKHSVLEARRNQWEDRWVNEPLHPGHWTNSFGWRNNFDHDGKSLDQDKQKECKVIPRDLRSKDIFRHCQLYVTCEPCIMCAAALAMVGIRRVVFGCKNERFGGCGSLLHLHESENADGTRHAIPTDSVNSRSESSGYEIKSGILEEDCIRLLRSFYDRENFHAPDDKRRRKNQP